MSDPAPSLRLEPEDLDGHTIDELTDYLEAGREPVDLSIEDSPACRIALDALQRLHDLAGDYLEDDSPAPEVGRGWIDAVLAAIPIDARPGRRFPIPVEDPQVSAQITEGAIRGLIRTIGDELPGLLVGAVRIDPGEPAAISVDVALVYGTVLADAAGGFRRELRRVLPDHVPFDIGRIDIAVVGLIAPPAGGASEGDR